ncbi:hypothetical protein NX059_006677 [Plenodomus lindquistii]|nr:hypothetical protein NX059_006677 [Plenodomus lindquistii]
MSHHDIVRPHNPWERFTARKEENHVAEDISRLCPSPQTTTSTVIERFMTHKQKLQDRPIPRQRQLLRDFLAGCTRQPSSVSQQRYFEADIIDSSATRDIALLDDRQRHSNCAKLIGNDCPACVVFSKNLSIHELFLRLQAKLSWGFFLEFHISYHALRSGPLRQDSRFVSGKPLREHGVLPLREETNDPEELYYYEAQTSSLCWGYDEWFWTELFLVDTWFGSEENHQTYLTNSTAGNGFDPPLAGSRTFESPCLDPREYFLLKLDRRLEQAATEYSALIEAFIRRMDEHARTTHGFFHDNERQELIRTLSTIIETIQIFVDAINGTIDAWETFYRTQIALFTVHARDKPTWPDILDSIIRSISELMRLRNLLLRKKQRFRFKLESSHNVSSLGQTETGNLQARTAVKQGEDLRILTKMTVYVAFPLLFTTAAFGMDFVTPKYPWALFFAVLICTSLANWVLATTLASEKAPWEVWVGWKVDLTRSLVKMGVK